VYITISGGGKARECEQPRVPGLAGGVHAQDTQDAGPCTRCSTTGIINTVWYLQYVTCRYAMVKILNSIMFCR
jgi:hypothetical protein